MATLWEKIKMGFPSRSPLANNEPTLDYAKIDLDLLSNLFGIEEVRKQLLTSPPMENVTTERILKDAQAMGVMLNTYPWKIYEQALWRRTLGSLRESLSGQSPEMREAARHKVIAHLSALHLPYELKHEAERIKKMQEMTKAAQQPI